MSEEVGEGVKLVEREVEQDWRKDWLRKWEKEWKVEVTEGIGRERL